MNAFGSLTQKRQGLQLFELGQVLAISAMVCAVGFGLASAVGLKDGGILAVTVLMVALATLLPGYFGQLQAAETLGTLLMQVFFAAIGASANISVVMQVGPILLVLAAVILTIHLLFLLVTGRLLGLELAELTIASNANMGGTHHCCGDGSEPTLAPTGHPGNFVWDVRVRDRHFPRCGAR